MMAIPAMIIVTGEAPLIFATARITITGIREKTNALATMA